MKISSRFNRFLILSIVPVYLICSSLVYKYITEEHKQDITRDCRSYGMAIREILLVAANSQINLETMGKWIQRANRTSNKFSIELVSKNSNPDGIDFTGLPIGSGRTIELKSQQKIITYISLKPQFNDWALRIMERTEFSHESQNSTALIVFGVTALPFVLCILGISLLSRKLLLNPLRKLSQQAHLMGQGEVLDQDLVPVRDEIDEVFNKLVDLNHKLRNSHLIIEKETSSRKVLEDSLKHENRLSLLGRLSAGLAHELGTPLHVILGYSRLLQGNQIEADKQKQSAKIIEEQVRRMSNLVQGILDFSKPKTLNKSQLILSQLIEKAIRLGLSPDQRRSIPYQLEGDVEQTLIADENQLLQVLINLIQNAVQAMESQKSPELRVKWSLVESLIKIDLIDNGIGMSEEQLNKIFEPFYTTREVGSGTGLGLSIAYGIVKEHKGRLIVSSSLGKGSCFSIELPRE